MSTDFPTADKKARAAERKKQWLSSSAFELSRKEVDRVQSDLKLFPTSRRQDQEPAYRLKERLEHNDRYSAYRQTKVGSTRIGKPDYSLRPESKRSQLVLEDVVCASCLCLHDRGWRYAESSRGVVYLCLACKAELHRRFIGEGKADAMLLAVGRKRSRG